MLQWPLMAVQQHQFLEKGLVFHGHLQYLRRETQVSLKLVQQLSSGKALLTAWSLAKQEEKTGHGFGSLMSCSPQGYQHFCYWFGSLMSCCLFSPGVPAAALLLSQPCLLHAVRWLCSFQCSPLPSCVTPDPFIHSQRRQLFSVADWPFCSGFMYGNCKTAEDVWQ